MFRRSSKLVVGWVVLLLLLFSSVTAFATIREGGKGLLFGEEHAFFFTAAKGWVMDNESGASQGIYMAFYPAGFSWSQSPVIAYGSTMVKNSKVHNVKEAVEHNIQEFRDTGNDNYKGEFKEELPLPDGKKVYIYHFSGDKWGNYEAIGYIEENDTINYLVLNAQTKEAFEKSLPAFKAILLSYKNAYVRVSDAEFKKLLEASDKMAKTKSGMAYEDTPGLSNMLSALVTDCVASTPKESRKDFDMVVKIEENGEVTGAYIKPENMLSRCVQAAAMVRAFPMHRMGTFLEHVHVDLGNNLKN